MSFRNFLLGFESSKIAIRAFVLLCSFGSVVFHASAEPIRRGNTTAELGPDFFVDTAAIGGTDSIGTELSFELDFAPLTRGIDGSDLLITGLGWASPGNGVTASQISATITYLGADGQLAGGDDLLLGERSASLNYAGAGEYFWHFDAPIHARIDATQTRFHITLDAGGTGEIRLKNDAEENPKFSVSGSAVALEPVNLALYRNVIADSNLTFARYATDGIVGSDFKWIANNGASLPLSLEIEFPGPVEIGSYHLFHGVNDNNKSVAFHLEHFGPNGWEVVSGSGVSNNSDSENAVAFPAIWVDRLRLKITASSGDGRPRVREWAVFAPSDAAPYPLGTGVQINVAQDGLADASSSTTEQPAIYGVDGFLSTHWRSDAVGPHTFEARLRDEINIRSVHIHSGIEADIAPITDFSIEYRPPGSASWTPAPGGTVAANTEADRIVDFDFAVGAEAIRLTIADAGEVAIRELQVFPENGLGGYPLRINTFEGPPPDRDFMRYGDAFYRILSDDGRVLRGGPGAVALETVNPLDPRQIHQVLLNADGSTYRFFNRHTRETLAVDSASPAVGASLMQAPHSAFPSHQWHVRRAPGDQVYLQNAFSGLFAEATDSGAVQQPFSGSPAQRWTLDFQQNYPKKGSAGFPQLAAAMGSSWAYSWTNNDLPDLDTNQVDFTPMQWGRFNLDPDNFNAARQLPTTLRYPDWFNRGYPLVQLGFNEPDKENQANMSVDLALEIWPQLMASGLPLLSPVTAQVDGQWMIDFMAEADARGYRNDFIGMHTYIGPFPDLIMDSLNSLSATYGDRPVWLTEFGFSDFEDTQNWTENQLYRAMLELLWRLEDEPDCARYSLFGFIENGEFPQPTDPTGRMRRSNWLDAQGNFTSIGELYMGWDGQLAPIADQPYILYNRSFDQRVANPGDGSVDEANIRVANDSVRLVFESIGNGFYHITSLLDGKRLRQTGPETVEWAAPGTTGAQTEWSWRTMERGWQLITNRNSGRNLRYTPDQGVHMGPADGSFYHWFFIPTIHRDETLAPAPPANPSATPEHQRVDLAWTGSVSADIAHYRVKRATDADGPFVTIAPDLFVTEYRDTAVTNGQEYLYQIEAVDAAGNAAASAQVAATPEAPLPDTYANWALVAFGEDSEPSSTLPSSDPDSDGQSNFFEYAFLLNPTKIDAARVNASVDSVSGFQLSFALNRHATDFTWDLFGGTSLTGIEGWELVPFSILSESVTGDFANLVIAPDTASNDSMFFTIKILPDSE